MSDAMRDAGKRLHRHLFNGRFDIGNVAMGADRLYVMVYGRWLGQQPDEWEGFPVEWRTETGMAVAFDAAGSAG